MRRANKHNMFLRRARLPEIVGFGHQPMGRGAQFIVPVVCAYDCVCVTRAMRPTACTTRIFDTSAAQLLHTLIHSLTLSLSLSFSITLSFDSTDTEGLLI